MRRVWWRLLYFYVVGALAVSFAATGDRTRMWVYSAFALFFALGVYRARNERT